ncbi:MAG: HD domain-containing protein [Patescibacteria group bacterium]
MFHRHSLPDRATVLSTVESLRNLYALRRVVRWGNNRLESVRIESVTEHTFNTSPLADLFYHLDPEVQGIDLGRVHTLLRYHDFAEVGAEGDIPQTKKNDALELSSLDELERIMANHPLPLRKYIREAVEEFDKAESREAQFALACDKLEPSFELYFHGVERVLPPMSRCIPENAWHGWTSTARIRATGKFPVMHHYGNILAQEIEKKIEAYRRSFAVE